MVNLLLGTVAFGAAAVTFWLLLPKGGKSSPIAESTFEAYYVVGLVGIIGLGIGLVIDGATTAFK